jgi:hypothetical protein
MHQAHLVLRNSRAMAEADPGLVGNLLVERLAGAHIHQVTKHSHGADVLGRASVRQPGRQCDVQCRDAGSRRSRLASGL